MFHNRKLNNHINRIRERAFRIVYQDSNSKFEELLAKHGSFKTHGRNVQKLLKYLKLKWSLLPKSWIKFLTLWNNHILLERLRFKSRNIRTVKYGIETAAFVGSRIWSYMPSELKESTSLNEFRLKMKTWKPENCPCKLCQIYLQRIGYLQVTN